MAGGSWTFLSNHGHVLIYLGKNPEARIREIADAVGITERSAQGIIADLEEGGYITINRIGRRNTYRINSARKFRHPEESDQSIAPLLKIFSK
jgi:predicted transcriptional regulator